MAVSCHLSSPSTQNSSSPVTASTSATFLGDFRGQVFPSPVCHPGCFLGVFLSMSQHGLHFPITSALLFPQPPATWPRPLHAKILEWIPCRQPADTLPPLLCLIVQSYLMCNISPFYFLTFANLGSHGSDDSLTPGLFLGWLDSSLWCLHLQIYFK